MWAETKPPGPGGFASLDAADSTARPRRRLEVKRLGSVAYPDALALQAERVEQRRSQLIPDQLLLLEHPHVITLGTSADESHILVAEDERNLLGIPIFPTGRGGDVTYHGPGQLVGYPILDLTPDRCDLHRYVRDLEETIIRVLADFAIPATRSAGHTGVWVDNRKIAAIGVRVSSRWITSHGFALNVTTDLRYFDAIVPCGIRDRGVTSMSLCLGMNPPIDAIADSVTTHFCDVFHRSVA